MDEHLQKHSIIIASKKLVHEHYLEEVYLAITFLVTPRPCPTLLQLKSLLDERVQIAECGVRGCQAFYHQIVRLTTVEEVIPKEDNSSDSQLLSQKMEQYAHKDFCSLCTI